MRSKAHNSMMNRWQVKWFTTWRGTIPHPRRWLGSSWTFHKPARIKCSPHSPQTSRRTVEEDTQAAYEQIWHTSWEVIGRRQHLNHSNRHTVCVECVSPWSSGLHRGPPTASQRRQPSSARCWPGRPLRPESPEGWSCCLHSPVQSCSTLEHIQRQTHPFISTEKHDREWDWIRYFLPSCTGMFQCVETLVVHAHLRLTPPGSVNKEREIEGIQKHTQKKEKKTPDEMECTSISTCCLTCGNQN